MVNRRHFTPTLAASTPRRRRCGVHEEQGWQILFLAMGAEVDEGWLVQQFCESARHLCTILRASLCSRDLSFLISKEIASLPVASLVIMMNTLILSKPR